MKKNQVIFISILLLLAFGLGSYAYAITTRLDNGKKNSYDYSFSEVVNYVNNIENYLAKAMISRSPKHSAEILTRIWNEANLTVVYLENIPFDDKGTSQCIKFLNQVSDYSYTLSRKSIDGKELDNNDFENLKKLYKYSVDLKNTVNEMALELNNGTLSWEDLNNTSKLSLSTDEQIDVFASINSNFDDYEGLIYDGAYADFVVKTDKLGLIGDDIDANAAQNKIKEIFGDDNVEKIEKGSDITSGDIESYNFSVKLKDYPKNMEIEIAKKGGWIIEMVKDKDVGNVELSEEDAIKRGKDFLDLLGYKNMKETYSLNQSNIVTINYAYEENGILMYPDLIKVKVALDNGEILGMEATGYLNSHVARENLIPKINSEEAKKTLNDNLQIENERLVVIPLNNNTEVFCYEFKGKIEDKEFLVYINANTGEEEEILVLLETTGGTLTI